MRSFLAINLPRDLKEEIGKLVSGLNYPGIKKVSPENFHITMRFLGEIDDRQAEAIKKKLGEIEAEKFKVSLDKICFFPNENRMRVIWIGVKEGQDKIINLQKEIDLRLEELGFPKEQNEFKPHLTIARIKFIKDKKRILEDAGCIKIEKSFTAESFDLMQSILDRSGPEYSIVSRFEFRQ